MNEFTKEELESLRNGIFVCMGSSSLWKTSENNSLVDKIQSMIDNYCEHREYKMIVNYDNDFVNVCVKCGKS